jgi:hypothetical protein
MRLTHTSKLSPEQALEVRRLYSEGGHSQNKLARLFGVAQATINNVVLNKTYREEKKDEDRQ